MALSEWMTVVVFFQRFRRGSNLPTSFLLPPVTNFYLLSKKGKDGPVTNIVAGGESSSISISRAPGVGKQGVFLFDEVSGGLYVKKRKV